MGVPADPRLLEQLRRQQIRGPFQITHLPDGTLINPLGGVRPAGGSTSNGPFCRKLSVGTDPATSKLLGGVVSGGIENITVPDITLCEIGSEPADGTQVYLSVSVTAYTDDDVLVSGGDVTAATPGEAADLPANVIPTYDSPSGTLIIPLGVWSQGKFIPSGCGNFQVSHCPGALTYIRA